MHDVDHRHHLARLSSHGPSEAMLSSDPRTQTAIVFVHGFGGSAATTWAQFQKLVDEIALDEPWWRKSDLYFYGYRSISQSTNDSSRDLRQFLVKVFPQPDPHAFAPALTEDELRQLGVPATELAVRPGPYFYNQLILVGHSEGGLILRLAIRDIAKRYAQSFDVAGRVSPDDAATLVLRSEAEGWTAEQWKSQLSNLHRRTDGVVASPILDASLRLFAPAISGARITGPLAFVYQTFIGSVSRAALASSKAFNDLSATSPVLVATRRETEKLYERFPHLRSLSADVLWGRADNIVFDMAYGNDRDESISDKTHTSVCKPLPNFLRPIRFVEQGLK